MFKQLLYPSDFSEVSKKALVYLKGMKSAGTREVIDLRVISDKKMECISKGIAMSGKDASRFLKEVYEGLLKEAVDEMAPVEKELKEADLEVKKRIERGAPHAKILEVAAEEGISAIVIG